MDDKEKEWEFTPKVVAHVTGQRYPKDIYYRMHKKLVARFTLSMPDGFLISVPIYEGESDKEKLNSFIDNWYKVTNEDPKKFDHFDIKDKCPKCGGPMRCKIVGNQAMIWCLDRNCVYQDIEENPKARERVYEKFGLKVKYVHKTGCAVIFSNKPIKK